MILLKHSTGNTTTNEGGSMTVIGFIPARGGSVRIPRKNLRTVDGVPLVARMIDTLRAAGIDTVIVSTDDHEIAQVAQLWGADIDVRPANLLDGNVTIDQVVDEWLSRHIWRFGERQLPVETLVCVAQCTSPLLSPATVANAVDHARENGTCVFTTVGERHLLWSESTVPLFGVRRNSTSVAEPDYYRETGGLVVFDAVARQIGDTWPPMPRTMMTIDDAEGIDIDDYGDLVRARAGQAPSRIQLRYAESFEIGSGHRRRCETLAIELMGRHHVDVVEHDKVPLPEEYDVTTYGSEHRESIGGADVVVLDILDTTKELIDSIRAGGVKHVVTLEDVGTGSLSADVTVNELYRAFDGGYMGYRSGPRYAVLRPEFQGHPFGAHRPSKKERTPLTVVVSFGGTDPGHFTEQAVDDLCELDAVERIRVIAPPGRQDFPSEMSCERTTTDVIVVRNAFMAAEFLAADLAVTSCGRTVHEVAACGTPVIAVAVNDRERLHHVCPGVVYLNNIDGLKECAESYLSGEADMRADAFRAHEAVDGLGAQRIAYLIDGLLGGML